MPTRIERRLELTGDVETLDGKPLASGVTLRIELWRTWVVLLYGPRREETTLWEWKGTLGGCESGELAIGHHMRFRAPDGRTGDSAPDPVEVKGPVDAST